MTVLSLRTRVDPDVFMDGSRAGMDLINRVVLASATEMAIEFDISWEADEPWSEIVGDRCK